LSTITSS
jgi:hypothetical protein